MDESTETPATETPATVETTATETAPAETPANLLSPEAETITPDTSNEPWFNVHDEAYRPNPNTPTYVSIDEMAKGIN